MRILSVKQEITNGMKTLQYKCTLLTDVILNSKSATEGPNKTLDFIPGNCFLGIAAGSLYKEMDEHSYELFHSGRVRFSDAHPALAGRRSVKVPASVFYPKLKSVEEECVLFHGYDRARDAEDRQLKQCRNGFYAFADGTASPVSSECSFAIKSAYDRNTRKSMDSQMYGYESLGKGQVFYFDIQIDNDELEKELNEALKGTKRLGRSRTAQYGLVEIEPTDFTETESRESSDEYSTVYADGRLIFYDFFKDMPTYQPSARDLGFDGEIVWNKSQVRTFCHSPWNYKRQSYDCDRCGIEKGSVFVVRGKKIDEGNYVGCYRNEGFGRIIVNPDFLEVKPGTNGEALYSFKEKESSQKSSVPRINQDTEGSVLLEYLNRQVKEQLGFETACRNVNAFNKSLFSKTKFASQWGTIRSIAMASKNNNDIYAKVMKYISDGIKKDDWSGRRKDVLETFMKDNRSDLKNALINLCSEMAKHS